MVLKLKIVYILIFIPFNINGEGESRETHFPGYNYCGPGTKFLERTSKGQVGVNKLDDACRTHDAVYTNSTDLKTRMEADVLLETLAWERVLAKDSTYKEKFVAWMVTNVMKMKRKWNTRRLRREYRRKTPLMVFFK